MKSNENGLNLAFLGEYAIIAAGLIKADIEIIGLGGNDAKGNDSKSNNAKYTRVFGTGALSGEADILSLGTLYDAVIAAKTDIMIHNPRRHYVCDKCPKRLRCLTAAEAAFPVLHNEKVIGAVGLAATYSGKATMLADKDLVTGVMRMLMIAARRTFELAASNGTAIHIEEHDSKTIRPLADIEMEEIMRAIDICGNTTQGKRLAAEKLGIGVATLYRKLGERMKGE